MLALNDSLQKNMEKTFPYLNYAYTDNKEELELLKTVYDLLFISVFDHWLSREECDSTALCFADFLQKNDVLYLQNIKKFEEFYEQLFYVGIISWKNNKKCTRVSFDNFDSKESYIDRCKVSIREEKSLSICIPDWEVVICGGFDLTHNILVKKGVNKDALINLVNKSHLYLLG